jgi:hypothetical protein
MGAPLLPINLAYGEYKELNLKIIVSPNKAQVIEEINPRTIVSTINIQAVSQKISHVLATDEKNTVLTTSQNQNNIRIDTLGASHVVLTYDAYIVSKTPGVSNVDYNSTNLESVVVLPAGSEIISVNNVPIDIKNDTITMPAGHTAISYVTRTVNQNNFVASKNGINYQVDVITASKIEKFNFNSQSKSLSMSIDDQTPILVIIPKSLLAGPYNVEINGKQISSKDYYQNSTHEWIRIDPSDTGVVQITGSSAMIPEFFSTSLFVLAITISAMIILQKKLLYKF